jgi:hypothetical protein
MYFTRQATLWLQSVESKVEKQNWQEFCTLLNENFGKNQYKVLIMKLRKLKQVGTVLEYVECFNNLMHQMLAHNSTIDQEIFTTAFIDGLKEEIRSIVIIKISEDLDAASSLALLHEEVLESIPPKEEMKDHRRKDPSNWARSYTPGLHHGVGTTPIPAHNGFRSGSKTLPEDRRGTEAARARNSSDKVNALRSWRRARGLCFTCGVKWNQTV